MMKSHIHTSKAIAHIFSILTDSYKPFASHLNRLRLSRADMRTQNRNKSHIIHAHMFAHNKGDAEDGAAVAAYDKESLL